MFEIMKYHEIFHDELPKKDRQLYQTALKCIKRCRNYKYEFRSDNDIIVIFGETRLIINKVENLIDGISVRPGPSIGDKQNIYIDLNDKLFELARNEVLVSLNSYRG